MGCDIHSHFEVKINGKWEHYSTPDINRNYRLFEKMAGVRGSVSNAISPPKGLPEDMSAITNIDANRWFNEIGAHSPSWLSSSEFKVIYEFHDSLYDLENYGESVKWRQIDEVQYGYLFGNRFKDFESGSEGYPKEIEDFRLVFWFDN